MDQTGVTTTERNGCATRGSVPVLAVALVGVAALLGAVREAKAMSVDGTLVTNVVSATYHSLAGQRGAANGSAPIYEMSYLASANVLVSCPMLMVIKTASPTTDTPLWWWDPSWDHAWGTPGGLVTFVICTVNTSQQASAFNILLTDRYDQNVMWDSTAVPGGWLPGGTTSQIQRSADDITYNNGAPGVGQAGPYYLRWVLNILGPGKSACVSYALEVK